MPRSGHRETASEDAHVQRCQICFKKIAVRRNELAERLYISSATDHKILTEKLKKKKETMIHF